MSYINNEFTKIKKPPHIIILVADQIDIYFIIAARLVKFDVIFIISGPTLWHIVFTNKEIVKRSIPNIA